jgi:hypothetical protein
MIVDHSIFVLMTANQRQHHKLVKMQFPVGLRGKVVYIEFQSTENLFPITPGPINPNTDEIGFLINLYGTTSTGRDASLANEAGDVMYRIEYPDAALRGGVEIEESKYRSGGAGGYSFDVEDLYKGRKASGEGKSIASNPYPLLIE